MPGRSLPSTMYGVQVYLLVDLKYAHQNCVIRTTVKGSYVVALCYDTYLRRVGFPQGIFRRTVTWLYVQYIPRSTMIGNPPRLESKFSSTHVGLHEIAVARLS